MHAYYLLFSSIASAMLNNLSIQAVVMSMVLGVLHPSALVKHSFLHNLEAQGAHHKVFNMPTLLFLLG
jgi:hypothetical protein